MSEHKLPNKHEHGCVSREYFSRGNRKVFRISGMDCADCAQKLEKRVNAIPGTKDVRVNYGAAKMTLEYDGDSANILRVVKQAGYSAMEHKEGAFYHSAEKSFWRGNVKALTTLVSAVVFLIAFSLSFSGLLSEFILNVIYAVVIIIGGQRIAKSGFSGLKSRTIGIDFLMTIAVLGAAAIGQWEEGGAVVVLFSLGETLEAYAMERTRRSIRSLMDLTPQEASVRRDGAEMRLAVEDIRLSDILIVKPGEKLAMDGIVWKGHSAVNQAPITGESVPVEKSPGDEVFAGTINQQGMMEIKVTKLAKDNTISRIIEMVEEAQAQKAPSQKYVDVFARYYTPAVIAIAVGLAVFPPLFFAQPFDSWLYRALTMLVVSCPCALVISTPVSIVSAIGNAARHGVLIKGGAYLELLGSLSAIAIDKTGTLTKGVPEVTDVIPLAELSQEEMMSVAAAIENRSEHPLAQAIVRYARKQGIVWPECDEFRTHIGQGASATVRGERFYIGSPKFFLALPQVDLSYWRERIASMQHEGKTVMLLGTDQKMVGLIGVADQVREFARETVEELKNIGIKAVYMLTGDNQGSASAIARQAGNIAFKADLLPEDKVQAVRELIRQHGEVAMVGDGINDAPSLATAAVGIAMGAAGSDTALETADIALMTDDLTKIPYAIRLSRRALTVIKQNIAFSLLVKAVFLALVLPGWTTLWMAVLADTGASLLVILNGMRLLRDEQKSGNALSGNFEYES